jgi:hypothetical protein
MQRIPFCKTDRSRRRVRVRPQADTPAAEALHPEIPTAEQPAERTEEHHPTAQPMKPDPIRVDRIRVQEADRKEPVVPEPIVKLAHLMLPVGTERTEPEELISKASQKSLIPN